MTTPRRGPGRPRRAEQRDTADDIVLAATALFARRGFDAVGMRDVAASAGVDVATVHHHAGTKAELYQACFARVFAAESSALIDAVAAAQAGIAEGKAELFDRLHALLDAFVDFLEEVPETTGLWLRRWSEPDRHTDLDESFATPLYQAVEQVLDGAAEAGLLHEPHPHIAVRSLVWAVHAHVSAGSPDRKEFRSWVHRWLDRMYA
ncbi:AcrR family transcriptional regulator [Allocatelliglobosispora scoriae]|uniref:AcrR family transcriptional regulator n=1 Tax=Allocatelliglobosispora scoriae TaxID=643052 RepID=A0A841BMF3_9ACTN|nr:TetR/AcrR family transcriptional regulator [Allocatelliglobosispora scoriae]MBB5868845.1 AcrR family transcriptional regulator [Allocatelliglobosispora scoriae]